MGKVTERSESASTGMEGSAGATAQSCPDVTLEIGVFFDGTGNNTENVAADGGRTGGASYSSANSNVSLLFPLYKSGPRYNERADCGGIKTKFFSIYKQGIGTTSGESDYWPGNLVGAGTGTGRTGVEARVFEACVDVGNAINTLSPGVEPKEIILDVFGFSRGAAAARYFVNCFKQGFVEYYAYYVNKKRAYLPEGREVTIRYVGIFDTVAAIGRGDNDDHGDVNVHLSTSQADRIYHLTAEHEYRKNFRLNHNIPGGGDTRELPGAHSDVGGGYSGKGDETVVQRTQNHIYGTQAQAASAWNASNAQASAERASQTSFWASEGWILPNEPSDGLMNTPTPITTRYIGGAMGGGSMIWSYNTGARLVRPWVEVGLSRIPLRIMYDQGLASEVPFTSFPTGNDYTVPAGLEALAPGMSTGGATPGGASKRAMLRNYGHVSANHGSIGMAPDTNFVRIIYPNDSGKAK